MIQILRSSILHGQLLDGDSRYPRLFDRAIGNSEQLRSLTVNTGKFLVDITSTVHAGTSYAYVKFLITRTERTDKRSRISKSDSRPWSGQSHGATVPGHPNLIHSAH